MITVGVIGVGGRGSGLVSEVLNNIEDVRIKYICDTYKDRADAAADAVMNKKGVRPETITDYKKILEDGEIDAVMNYSAWETHFPIAKECMKAGKICGFEVGGAYSVKQCFDLVKTYKETGVPCMMLENCCYDMRETMILNMVRKGVFGEIVHCEGGYRHDLRDEVAFGNENRHYRLRNYINRNCENYPTHELGPIAKILDINRGNRMVSLCSMASKAAGLEDYIKRYKPDDEALKGMKFAQGDVVTTMIKCARGETITLHLDTTLPGMYTRDFTVQGTRAIYTHAGDIISVDGLNDHTATPAAEFEEKYLSPVWKEYRENTIGAHGGIDWLVHKAFFDTVRRGDKDFPIDVYDSVSWAAITALSEISIANGSAPVEIPDFTDGAWITRKRRDVEEF